MSIPAPRVRQLLREMFDEAPPAGQLRAFLGGVLVGLGWRWSREAAEPGAPEPVAVIPAPPAEEDAARAEAFDLFAEGRSARDVAGEFDIPLSQASRWKGEWDQQQRQEHSP